ncbi:alpha/beta fold hydrolase [Paenibacillus sp. HW567]|uniref:alpha/beta fold hydrolase n=1 Tax=Paenibacillus sp. HW567 TaxID=1034769 RepID=UPI001E5144D5|nr:alpha/beta hydrolase [Paenibacillus sp. HW567]
MGTGQLHLQVTGEGEHTVVLEAGMGGCSLDFSLVQPELSQIAKVISYDRAGLGWSDKPLERATCRDYVRDLRQLLKTKDCKPPYLLVGHSYGGMIVRFFAAEYPEEVEGLLLIDAAHESRYLTEEMSDQRKRQIAAHRKQYKLGYLLAPTGILSLLQKHVGARHLPASMQKTARVLGYRSNAYSAVYTELLDAEESALQLRATASLREDLPITVLSAGKQDAEWKQGQAKLADVSPAVKQVIAEDSWHSIQIHRPDIVIAAVKELITELDNPQQ